MSRKKKDASAQKKTTSLTESLSDSSISRSVRAILASPDRRGSQHNSRSRRKAIKIACSISGAVLLLISAYSLNNWSETLVYSSTSHQLTQLIAQAQRDNPDVDQLRIQQRQVSAELDSQSSRSVFQIPRVRKAIASASTTSTRLSRMLSDMADGKTWEQAQKDTAGGTHLAGTSTASSNGNSSSSGRKSGSSSKNKGTSSNASGKTESEQQQDQIRRKENEEAQKRQQKLNDLLKQNSHSSSETTVNNSNAKPW